MKYTNGNTRLTNRLLNNAKRGRNDHWIYKFFAWLLPSGTSCSECLRRRNRRNRQIIITIHLYNARVMLRVFGNKFEMAWPLPDGVDKREIRFLDISDVKTSIILFISMRNLQSTKNFHLPSIFLIPLSSLDLSFSPISFLQFLFIPLDLVPLYRLSVSCCLQFFLFLFYSFQFSLFLFSFSFPHIFSSILPLSLSFPSISFFIVFQLFFLVQTLFSQFSFFLPPFFNFSQFPSISCYPYRTSSLSSLSLNFLAFLLFRSINRTYSLLKPLRPIAHLQKSYQCVHWFLKKLHFKLLNFSRFHEFWRSFERWIFFLVNSSNGNEIINSRDTYFRHEYRNKQNRAHIIPMLVQTSGHGWIIFDSL